MKNKPQIVCTHDPKYAKGMCRNCYEKSKYRNDDKIRAKKIASATEYRNEKRKKDPDWNAKRQRDFRKKNPVSFNKTMSKYYMRKLPTTEIVNIYNDVMKERGAKT